MTKEKKNKKLNDILSIRYGYLNVPAFNDINDLIDQQNKALIKEVEGLKEKLIQSSIEYDVMEIANESLHKQLEESKKERDEYHSLLIRVLSLSNLEETDSML